VDLLGAVVAARLPWYVIRIAIPGIRFLTWIAHASTDWGRAVRTPADGWTDAWVRLRGSTWVVDK
jgi:hypothetical protein